MKLSCKQCSISFERSKRNINPKQTVSFCTKSCFYSYSKRRTKENCHECGKGVERKTCERIKNSRIFCNNSCSARYHNRNKTTGTKRSNLERWLETQIRNNYPSLEMLCSDRTLDFELDFYFPKLRLAIEINGIVHYEPIYGESTFVRTKNRDQQKIITCDKLGIELIVVPHLDKCQLSKVQSSYWTKIHTILDKAIKRAEVTGPDPDAYH